MAVIYLIRHAKPAISGVIMGGFDPPIEEGPIPPADFRVAAVFSSPLLRARQTAAKMFPEHSLVIVPDLAEIGMGEWEGKRWDEIEAAWPALAWAKIADWKTVTPPSGEEWRSFEARVKRAWETILKSPLPAAVVAHAGVNAVLRAFASGGDSAACTQDYCEVIPIETI